MKYMNHTKEGIICYSIEHRYAEEGIGNGKYGNFYGLKERIRINTRSRPSSKHAYRKRNFLSD